VAVPAHGSVVGSHIDSEWNAILLFMHHIDLDWLGDLASIHAAVHSSVGDDTRGDWRVVVVDLVLGRGVERNHGQRGLELVDCSMGLVDRQLAVRGGGGRSIVVRVSGRVLAFSEVDVAHVAASTPAPEAQDHCRSVCDSGSSYVGDSSSVPLGVVCRGSPCCGCGMARNAHLIVRHSYIVTERVTG